jgi:hypothetical protein
MNDCPNAEIRDQLPDLLHDRLDVSMRAAVMAHVDECVDCRSELELLRGVHGMLTAQTPRVDINYVVNALPKRAPQALRVVPRRRAWSDWRIAAAVTVLAIGGGSFAVLRQSGTTSSVTAPPLVSQANPASVDSTNGGTTRAADTVVRVADNARQTQATPTDVSMSGDEQTASAGLATTARLADLNERQLQALLDQIDQLQAVPITEPEPVTIRVRNQSSSPEGA